MYCLMLNGKNTKKLRHPNSSKNTKTWSSCFGRVWSQTPWLVRFFYILNWPKDPKKFMVCCYSYGEDVISHSGIVIRFGHALEKRRWLSGNSVQSWNWYISCIYFYNDIVLSPLKLFYSEAIFQKKQQGPSLNSFSCKVPLRSLLNNFMSNL